MTLIALSRFFLAAGVLSVAACTSLQVPGAGGGRVADVGPQLGGIASYVVADLHEGHVVMARGAEQRRPVAGLTNIATCVTALEFIRTARIDGGEVMTIPPQAQLLGATGPLGLQPGDALSIRDGIYAAMMGSDNYAAEALAVHLGARMGGGNPMSTFINQMNALAKRAGCGNTEFANAHGLELNGQKGYSTAADMARLSIYALKVPGFSFYGSQPSRVIAVRSSGGQSRQIRLQNTNALLERGGIDGVKTGATDLAGPCLVVSAPRPATVIKRQDGATVVYPHRLVVVALGASDRFNQGWALLQQGWGTYDQWRNAGSPAVPNSTLTTPAPQ